ncbi:hypothetical protein GQ44DRAFT_425333 [Phaeosphaeriaceae sp. PMI808]|nr:hypothetical protein GQ44DRAFT_425333 [Phaeosphaeriaceae sp. PMI808]
MAETWFSRLVMWLSPMVETRNEGPCFVRPSVTANRSRPGKKTRTPLVEGQGGGPPSGECAEGDSKASRVSCAGCGRIYRREVGWRLWCTGCGRYWCAECKSQLCMACGSEA